MSKCNFVQPSGDTEVDIGEVKLLDENDGLRFMKNETIVVYLARPGVKTDAGSCWVGRLEDFKAQFNNFDAEAQIKKDQLLQDHEDEFGR